MDAVEKFEYLRDMLNYLIKEEQRDIDKNEKHHKKNNKRGKKKRKKAESKNNSHKTPSRPGRSYTNSLLYGALCKFKRKCVLPSCRARAAMEKCTGGCDALQYYCCEKCQRQDWRKHRLFCKG
mmetsp:Transcript_2081/g.2641  ORF Transcript_2081/g.2641 Transcript_2081/m.2641 type:complete len:123 (-) Transcript_2081:240-608(-)